MLISTAISMVLTFYSCQSNREESGVIKDEMEMNEEAGDEKPIVEYPPTQLSGTAWKLLSYVYKIYNTETGEFENISRIFKPVDCADCYTLRFDSDYTGVATAISKQIKLDLREETLHIQIEDILLCEKYDKDGEYYCDITDFRNTLAKIGSYSVTGDELNLYSHYLDANGDEVIGSYLIFKKLD